MSPRTRQLRRLYFAGAAGAIILIAIITLYSLSDEQPSDNSQAVSEPQPVKTVPVEEQAEPAEPIEEIQPQEPERFSMSIELDSSGNNETPETEPAEVEPEQKLPTEQIEGMTKFEPEELPEEIPDTATTADARATMVIDEAMRLLEARPIEIIKAREMLNELLGMDISEHNRNIIKTKLSELADKWLFSRTVYPGDTLCSVYKVRSGDLLSTIGARYNVPWQILLRINNLHRPEMLQADQNIKVVNGPFHAKVNRSKFILDLYLRDTFVRSFPVGLGRPGHETPTGLWIVEPGGKLIKPRWTDPDTGRTYEADDPNYPLGSRWIGLEGLEGDAKGRTGFAIHGTKDPHEIGVAQSRGCIRLYNGDAILLYDVLMPGESKVVVTD